MNKYSYFAVGWRWHTITLKLFILEASCWKKRLTLLTFSDHVSHCIQWAIVHLRSLYRFNSHSGTSTASVDTEICRFSIPVLCYHAYGNSMYREKNGNIHLLQIAVVRFAFILKLLVLKWFPVENLQTSYLWKTYTELWHAA